MRCTIDKKLYCLLRYVLYYRFYGIHFTSFLTTEMGQVVESFPNGWQGPNHFTNQYNCWWWPDETRRLAIGSCDIDGLVISCGVIAVTTFLLFSVFKIQACYRDEGFVILAGFFAGFTGWCLSTTSSVSGGGSHVGMTTFSSQWITTEFFMKSHIYWWLMIVLW